MPVSIVVGGQFGSEGKGKVAHFLARERSAKVAVRVGGSNSGHTVIDDKGRRLVLRQLPTAAVLSEPVCVLSPGSYIDVPLLLSEIFLTRLDKSRLRIDPRAVIIEDSNIAGEQKGGLRSRIGSTMSGTGDAVLARISRSGKIRFAHDVPELQDYLADTSELLNDHLQSKARVIVEGTQGFGLSVLHGPYYPFATSRDCTAASSISEAGLSPMWVDEIALVIRAHPIRVSGNSGPLPEEISWEEVRRECGAESDLTELTSVTRSVRRVARFTPEIVQAAIRANAPTSLFMNHLDYVDSSCFDENNLSEKATAFVESAEKSLGRTIDYVGTSPSLLVSRIDERRTMVFGKS